jgi:aryl-alcohol dehydrogenase-like predicted oxidoreductase
MELRDLGSTGIRVSPLGLGTVKFGRNEQVKYPSAFDIPDDLAVRAILELARELGINLLDTAPAYGNAQQRLGKLLPGIRQDWVIVSKVGEIFEQGRSRFDFSYDHTVATVEQSLMDLQTDYLDCVLIHSSGDDLQILEQEGVLDALRTLKEKGLIRAHGMSSKTVPGGLRVVQEMDVVMATSNMEYDDERPVFEAAARLHKGVLVKKGLMSGHVSGVQGVRDAMKHVFSLPGISSMIIGTIDARHLRQNVAILDEVV